MFSRSIRNRTAAAAAAVALVGLTGCAGGSPSEAAVVDGTPVSQSEVTQGVEGLAVALNVPAQRINAQNVVGAMISGVQAEKIAERHGIAITDAERDATLAGDETGAQLVREPSAKELAYDLADAQIVSQKLGVQQYLAEAAAMTVTLNPRYGTWKDGQMVGDSGSLSEPASPTPTPGF